MKKIDSFINQYPLSKTLRFKLIPIGNTLENFKNKKLLEQDEQRAKDYERIKGYIDRYHKYFIESVLSSFHIEDENLKRYAELYSKTGKDEKEKAEQEKIENEMRKQISEALTKSKKYNLLHKKEMITELLPEYLTEKDELEVVESFRSFTSYFSGFYENRKNMYTNEKKSTGIAYRCIDDNLPKFLDNVRSYKLVSERLDSNDINQLNEDFSGLCGAAAENIFNVDYFSFVLSQSGIDNYNGIIGGYTTNDGIKIKGINEYINLYNQNHQKNERLPKMKPLFKQILSDKEAISFIPEKFESDNDVLKAINDFYNNVALNAINKVEEIFNDFNSYDHSGIFVQSGLTITELSNGMFGYWGAIQNNWNEEYDSKNMVKIPKNYEKYEDTRRKAFKAIKSFSIREIQRICEFKKIENSKFENVAEYISKSVKNLMEEIDKNYVKANQLISNPYSASKSLVKNGDAIELIKNLLDSIKNLEHFLKSLLGTGKEENKDEIFYGSFSSYYKELRNIDKLYDMVRNYVTQKPYSKDKVKLNFGNPDFLDGWAVSREKACSAQMFRDGNKYYIATMEKDMKSNEKYIYSSPTSSNDCIEKMVYQQVANPIQDVPNLMVVDGETKKINGRKETDGPHIGENLRLEKAKNTYLPEEINRIRTQKSYMTSSDSFSKKDLALYISYYMDRIREYYSKLSFQFKSPEEYTSYKEFLNHVDSQAYQISFVSVSKKHIMQFVDSGALYLFQIYNKDFSEYSKGTPNLHTMYFKMLFDEKNLANIVYQLNGGAEMFYRWPSIKPEEKIVHTANKPIKNKNPHTEKEFSSFEYDLTKDRRFTEPQFALHVPIILNFRSEGKGKMQLNKDVRQALKDCDDNYVIGIDRGERHLLYLCVINSKGEIVEQFSLNEIVNKYNDTEHHTNYRTLLAQKEKERLDSRKNWTTVENIKELKEGYISQVVHKICELMVKYDAVIAMEDLNSGFKNSRVKVEKQVYQKFEKMLIDKLNYYVNKQRPYEENGGLLKAYQLTNEFKSFSKMGLQNGFIFYVPAWLTSKIDPVTGFVDLLKPHYTNVEAAKDFIGHFKTIRYNSAENMFEFSFNYSDFPRGSTSFRNEWTICTNKDRILTFRNPDKNGNYDNKEINITEELKTLFDNAEIKYDNGDLKEAILCKNEKSFFKSFISLISLTLQMRNSVTNTEKDYLISPVRGIDGTFYDSREHDNSSFLPADADANGAYNIARKALWAIDVLKNMSDEELMKAKLSISNKEWLEFVQ